MVHTDCTLTKRFSGVPSRHVYVAAYSDSVGEERLMSNSEVGTSLRDVE